MGDSQKIIDLPVTIDGGLLLIVAEILREKCGLPNRDVTGAAKEISAALRRLDATYVN